jgi:hypothetical protein
LPLSIDNVDSISVDSFGDNSRTWTAREILRVVIVGACLAGVVAGHLIEAEKMEPVLVHRDQNAEYYQFLADAFLAGQLSLLVRPDPRLLALRDAFDPVANDSLRLHDASLFEGKYFLYYGPAPALTLFLPYRLVTGRHLAGSRAVAIFSAGGFLFLYSLLLHISRRQSWRMPLLLELPIILLLGLGTFVPLLLKRPAFYEVAISAGYCFVAGGFFFLALGLQRGRFAKSLLAIGGLCFGLSLGCRPHFLIAIALIALVVTLSEKKLVLTLSFVSPVAIAGLLLLWYNNARFHSPLEFGQTYQLSGHPSEHLRVNRFNFPEGAYSFLISPAAISAEYPYIEAVVSDARLAASKDPQAQEPVVGMFFASPLTILPFLWPLAFLLPYRVRPDKIAPATRTLLITVAVFAGSMIVFHCFTGWIASRYSVDFTPYAMMLACCILLSLHRTFGTRGRAWLLFAIVVVLTWSVTVNILVSLWPDPTYR